MVLPAVLVIVAAAGVAMLTQFLPNWRTTTVANQKTDWSGVKFIPRIIDKVQDPEERQKVNKNVHIAQWFPNEPDYALEMEHGEHGFYDFIFQNTDSEPVEVALPTKEPKGCDCTDAAIAIVPLPEALSHNERGQQQKLWRTPPVGEGSFGWRELPSNDNAGMEVAAGKAFVVRLRWEVRADKKEGDRLNLWVQFWTQPRGQPNNRKKELVMAPVMVTPKVRFDPEKMSLPRTIGPGDFAEGMVRCWSATQDDFQVGWIKNKDHPNIEGTIRALPDQDTAEFTQELARKKIYTHIKKAYEVTFKVWEEKDKHHLDMGPVRFDLPLQLSQNKDRLQVKKLPQVKVWVQSDIELAGNRKVIDLGYFPVNQEKTMAVVLLAESGTQLKALNSDPPFLQVKLRPDGQEGDKERWQVTVAVPPGRQSGPLPDNSGLLLEAARPDGQIRQVRIGITGTGTASPRK